MYGYDGSIALEFEESATILQCLGMKKEYPNLRKDFMKFLYNEVNKATTTSQCWTAYFNGKWIVYPNTKLKGA